MRQIWCKKGVEYATTSYSRARQPTDFGLGSRQSWIFHNVYGGLVDGRPEVGSALTKATRTNSELHSLRCDFEYKLAVADMLKDEAAFYFQHNVDFRGRAYTMHPHLNHLGADSSRACLVFAQVCGS